MLHLALATCGRAPDLGGELPRIAAALAAVDVRATPAVWDDPAVPWGRFDSVIVRATWDYVERAEPFRAWIDRVASTTRLANPAALLRWNVDKRYLGDLAAAGLPIVDTAFVAPGQPHDAARWEGWPELVVKPAVSAGGRLSGRFTAGDPAIGRTIARIHAEGTVAMVQPYVDAVDGRGEANVLAFGGVASHAVAKGGILAAGVEPDLDAALYLDQAITPLPLDDDLLAFTARALAALPFAVTGPHPPVYARIDSVVVADGTRRLIEAELVEPYLYLADAPDPEAAADRYAAAVRTWLDR